MSCYNIYELASSEKTHQIKVTCWACYFLQWFPKMFLWFFFCFFLKDAALGLDPRCICFQCASFCFQACFTCLSHSSSCIEVFPWTRIILNCLNAFSFMCPIVVAMLSTAHHTVMLTNPTSQIHFCICFVGKSDKSFYSSCCLISAREYSRTSTKFTERKGGSAWEGCQIQLFWCVNTKFPRFIFSFSVCFCREGINSRPAMLHMKMPWNNGDYIWKQDNRILLVL